MSLFAYQIMTAVAERKSFVRAAESLNLTPSAVSHAVAKLEGDFGLSLFRRSRTGASLTPDGERLLPHVRAVLNNEERLSQEVAGLKGLDRGTVRLATFHSVCINWIPDLVARFRQKYPGIEISVCQGNYADVTDWLFSGYADLGFFSLTLPPPGLEFAPLHRDRMVCVAAPDYRPADGRRVTRDDIKAGPIIWQQEGDDLEVKAMLGGLGLTIRRKPEAVQYDHCIVTLAEAGFGLGLIPELVLQGMVHRASVFPVSPPWYRTIALAHLQGQSLSPAAQAMRKHVLNFCREKYRSNSRKNKSVFDQ
jgi:DNA-binding transcriptional LysR family regulator